MEQIEHLWTGLLELLAQVITPTWGDLLQYVPLLLILLIGAIVALLAWAWQRNWTAGRPQAAPRLPPGRMPEGVHLPGPSPWPFISSIGLVLMIFALALGVFGSLTNLVVLGLGLMIGVGGVLGWLADAGREYRRVEAGAHSAGGGQAPRAGHAADAPAAEAIERQMPEGIHLPGPSAWPFLAPIGLAVALLGLVFGPALFIGGLVMGAIASLGWLRDAGREYRQVEAQGHAQPRTRDPEKAFPKALGPVYVGVATLALAITLLPAALGLLPGSGGGGGTAIGPEPTDTPYLSATSVLAFEQSEVAVFADRPFRLTFENKQAGVPHNVAIHDSPALATLYYLGEIFPGPATRVYEVGPLPAGTYWFTCSVHPPMTGTLYAR